MTNLRSLGVAKAGCMRTGPQEAKIVDRLNSGKLPREFRGWTRHAVISVALRRVYSTLPDERASDLMQRLIHDFRRVEG